MAFVYQEARLDTDAPDNDGMLAFRHGRLVAVLSRLSSIHDEAEGRWFVEALFRDCSILEPPTFVDLQAFEAWMLGAG
ncbi:hypothetical protein [Novosphingobium sp. 9U]|uniref:hypothetical protein n=1 Tax=Novosphingobium sp. 9U TaxID=2653158 RepID=UPI0013593001|nr:hypothetical protein [Novosphingobium sp. 9U]